MRIEIMADASDTSLATVISAIQDYLAALHPGEKLIIDIASPRDTSTVLPITAARDTERSWLREQREIFTRLMMRIPGMSKKELGARLGCARMNIYHYVRGEVLIPEKFANKVHLIFETSEDNPDIVRLREIARDYKGKWVRRIPLNPLLAEQGAILKDLITSGPDVTQKTLAQRLGTPQATLNDFLAGQRVLRRPIMEKLHEVLGVVPDDPRLLRLREIAQKLKK